MTTKAFSKGEAIRFGWATMKTNLGFFIRLLLVALVICIIPGIPQKVTEENAPVLSFLFGIVSWIF
jgi:flagellar biosynthesis protein FliQ